MRYLAHLSRSRSFKPVVVESDSALEIGTRVEIEIGSDVRMAYIVSQTSKSALGRVRSIVDTFLDKKRVELALWISEIYINPPGMVFDLSYPSFLDGYLVDIVVSNSPFLDFTEMDVGKFIEEKGRDELESLLRGNLVRLEKRFKLPKIRHDLETLIGVAPLDKIISSNLNDEEKELMSYILKEGNLRLRDLSSFPRRVVNSLLRKGIIFPMKERKSVVKLTEEQFDVLKGLESGENLVFGHTGSGKTEVYIHLAEKLKMLYLVPEASMIPQIVRRIRSRFPKLNVMTYHSYMSSSRRAFSWISAVRGYVDVLVGTRSALFVPFKWDLIVVDEDHDSSYYQKEVVVYDAVEIARKLSQLYSIPVVFGSATPNLKNYKKAVDGEIGFVKLSTSFGRMRKIVKVDMKAEKKRGSFALKTLDMMDKTLGKGKKILVFVRRRGIGRIVCLNCGNILKCPNCDVNLVKHSNETFKCHVCGYEVPVFDTCPKCGGFLTLVGRGTEKIEKEISKYFPHARIRRADRDVLSKPDQLITLLDELSKGKIDILIGTKMISKGIDVPGVELVVVSDMDGLLSIPDFSTTYKLFVELVQITGRVGRKEEGTAIVQYYSIDSWILSYLESGDVEGFYKAELERRKIFSYPPFSHLIHILKISKNLELSKEEALYVSKELENSGENVLGPVEHPIFRLKGNYRYQLVIKTMDLENSVSKLKRILSRTGFKGWKIFVDPPEMYQL